LEKQDAILISLLVQKIVSLFRNFNILKTDIKLTNMTKNDTNAGFGHFTGIKSSRNSLTIKYLQKIGGVEVT